MLTTFRADLHVHTCLSPCGDDAMRPLAIVRQAKKNGLDVIGICDHNSARNVAAVRRAGRREGMAVIGGVEVCSEEEVHVLGLFDREQDLQDMQRLIDENLAGENNPDLFGEQYLCDEHDAIIGRETRLLIGATRLTVEQVVDSIHRYDGLAIASHVDRQSFSVLSQLGFVPPGLQVDALEISSRWAVTEARARLPEIRDYPLVRSSDAHWLEDIGNASVAFTGDLPCIGDLRRALLGEGNRETKN